MIFTSCFDDLTGADVNALRKRGRVEQWACACAAFDRIDATATSQRLTLALSGVEFTDDTRALLLAECDAEQLARANTMSRTPDAWHVVRAGGQLRLATVSGYLAAVAALASDQGEACCRLIPAVADEAANPWPDVNRRRR